jgi:ATP-dependent protease ClpP protease subunit
MSLVPAVTELMLAELLYLQYDNPNRPIYMYINSTGVAVSGCFRRAGLQEAVAVAVGCAPGMVLSLHQHSSLLRVQLPKCPPTIFLA